MGPARIELLVAAHAWRVGTLPHRANTDEIARGGHQKCTVSDVRGPGYKKSYVDVMENVFGGVRISTDDEIRGRAGKANLRARPWLSGLTMSAVRVRLTRDDEDEKAGTIPSER
jgi:hypothetical protein